MNPPYKRREAHRVLKQVVVDHIAMVDRYRQVSTISLQGVSQAKGRPKLLSALHEFDLHEGKADPERHKARMAREEVLAQVAKHEEQNGFPTLFAQAIIIEWSLLEAFTRRLTSQWPHACPSLRTSNHLERVKAVVDEYAMPHNPSGGFFFPSTAKTDQMVQDVLRHVIGDAALGEVAR
jgi:hypothetical protein